MKESRVPNWKDVTAKRLQLSAIKTIFLAASLLANVYTESKICAHLRGRQNVCRQGDLGNYYQGK